jgi:hypothetical protein
MALNEFHLHLNALALSDDAHTALVEQRFRLRNFEPGEIGKSHFVPRIHLSSHVSSAGEYRHVFREACRILRKCRSFVGYLEGEVVVAENSAVGHDDVRKGNSQKFIVVLQSPVKWRESEVHISLLQSEVTDSVRDYFFAHGFSSIFTSKGGQRFAIFTLQGDYKVMAIIYDRVLFHLTKSGQFSAGKLKLERSAGHFLSPEFTWLPMQARAIFECP